MNLTIIKQREFNSVVCDFWQNENGDVFMTREQIGQALEYSDPRLAITKIHSRHKERLDAFSVSTKLVSTDGKQYETYVYNEKGIYEIIRRSQQPKADAFYDFVYDLLKGIRKGELKLVHSQETPSYMIEDPIKRAERWIEEQKATQQLETKNLVLEQRVNELQPKATYYDLILQNKSLIPISVIAKDYGMGAQTLNKKLHELGVQYKQGDIWLLYAKYQDKGYTQTQLHAIDAERSKPHTKWTQAGRIFIYELLKREGIVPMIERDFEEVN